MGKTRSTTKSCVIRCRGHAWNANKSSMIVRWPLLTRVSRWWLEVKGLIGQRAQTDWVSQLLDEDTPITAALAANFNSFLAALTSHFSPLNLTLADLDHNLDVPREFLVKVSSCYKARRQVKNDKSPGPSAVPNKICKQFASELAPFTMPR